MRYLKKSEFGDEVRVSIRTVDRWIAQKRIKTRTLVTGGVRIPSTEIEKCFRPNIQEFLKKDLP
jgi:predicted site-specific integrase-resolvase